MRVTTGLKGYKKDGTGEMCWTPEITIEHDGIPQNLDSAEIVRINAALTQQKDMIRALIDQWRNDGKRPSDAPQAPAEVPPAPAAPKTPADRAAEAKAAFATPPPAAPAQTGNVPGTLTQDQTHALILAKRSRANETVIETYLKGKGKTRIPQLLEEEAAELLIKIREGMQ
jgi:hypothetical protein